MSFWCFVLLSRCLIYKVHARQLPLSSALYFSTLSFACQALFSELSSSQCSHPSGPPSRATRSFYHTLSSLSRTFFEVFQGFPPSYLKTPSFLKRSALFERTHSVYHALSRLSSTFFIQPRGSVRLPPGLPRSFRLPKVPLSQGARL